MNTTKESFEKIQDDVKEASQKVQAEVSEKVRNVWLAGLGVLSTVEEEGSKLYNQFIEKGQGLIKKGEKFEKKAENVGEKIEDAVKYVEKKVKSVFDSENRPSRKDEITELNSKVDRLTDAVAALVQKMDQDKANSESEKA